jgi:hypothetical protein
MKKTLILFYFTILSFVAFPQYEFCYTEIVGPVPGYYMDPVTGCYEVCPSALCVPILQLPTQREIICYENVYENNTNDVIEVFFDYKLDCGTATIPGHPTYANALACLEFTCDGFVLDQACWVDITSANGPYLDYRLEVGASKTLVAYEIKGICNQTSNDVPPSGSIAGCKCPTLGLMINGVYYSFPGASVFTGGTIVSSVPLTGGQLQIVNIGGVIHFNVI